MWTQAPAILLAAGVLVGQLPDADPKALGGWLVSGAAVLAVGLLAKQLFFRDKAPGDRNVTRDELGASLGAYSRTDVTSRSATHGDLHSLESRLDGRDRGLESGLEELRRGVAVIGHEVEHQGKMLNAIGERLGVYHQPRSEGRTAP